MDSLERSLDANAISATATLNSIPEVDEDEIADLSVMKRLVQQKTAVFMTSVVKPFVDMLQIAGQNTSRQRRNLRKIVQLWESLQEAAEVQDEEVHLVLDEMARQDLENKNEEAPPAQETLTRPFFFVSWVYHMKLWAMEWLLLLGFELELYSTFEYSMIYGYVVEANTGPSRRNGLHCSILGANCSMPPLSCFVHVVMLIVY
jgi:hypothetical protein